MKSNWLLRSNAVLLMIFTLILGLGSNSYAQNLTVKGTVTGDDGLGMPGVTIMEKSTTNGMVTDFEGNYTLTVTDRNAILVFSFIGMQTQEVAVDGKSTINVSMKADMTEVDEVVVTALGIKRETKKVGFAMTEVEGEDIAKTHTVNPVQALQGKAAGVSIGMSDGGMFGNSKIQVRGVSVLNSNNNQPIFVVDGVILENSVSDASADWSASSDDFGNQLKNLNPDDFESVSVLKGAAATALYGSRGINGAVVITTKSGEGTRGLGVSVKQTVGIDYVYAQPDIQMEYGPGAFAGYTDYGQKDANDKYYRFSTDQFQLNGDGVPTIRNHSWATISYGPRFDGRQIEGHDGQMTTYAPVENNMLEAYNVGVNSNTSVAIKGGTEKANFILSDSYMHRTGVLPGNEFTKNALKFAASYKLTDWLKASASIDFTVSNPKNPRNDVATRYANGSWDNTYSAEKYNDSKYYTAVHGGVPQGKYGDTYSSVPGNGTWFAYNNNNYERNEQVVRPIVRLTADLTDWLSITAEGNMNQYTIKTESKELGSGFANDGGKYYMRHDSDISKTGKLVATINKNISEDITSTFIVGGEIWDQEKSYTQVQTDGGLIVPGQYFLENSKRTLKSEGKVFGTKQLNSVYFLANLGWKDQIYLDITGRNDWSSALVYSDGTGNYSYFYPSVSGSWLFSETINMPSWVSFGKLRLSWAQVGNDTNAYALNAGYDVGKIENDGTFKYTNSASKTLVDPDILPERKNSYEVGVDFRMFRNRLGFDFTWYNEDINNQIGRLSLDGITGYDNRLTNVGALRNRGIELSVSGSPIKTKDFEWKIVANYWKNETTVTDLHEDFGAYKVLGGSVDYGNYRVGSVAFEGGQYGVLMSDSKPKVDEHGNKILTWNDSKRGAYYTRSNSVEEIGSMQPDFECSLSNDFRYKNFTVSVMLDARFGGEMVSYSNKYGTSYGQLETSLVGRDENYGGIKWNSKYSDTAGRTYHDGIIPDGIFAAGQEVTTPAGTKQNVGGMTYREAYNKGYVEPTHASYFTFRNNAWSTGVVNDDWVSEVNYIAIRNISFAYDLPKTIAKRIKAQNINVAINARNLGYLYNSLPNNLNPESFRGTSSSTSFLERSFSPYTATYTFSVAVDF